MSNPVSVSSPAPAPSAPASPTPAGDLSGKGFVTKKPGSSREDLLARVNDTFRREMAAQEAPAVALPTSEVPSEPSAGDDGVTSETPVETTSEVATSAPAEGGEVPVKAPNESEKSYAHRVASAQMATAKAEQKALAAEERAKASEAKLAEFTAKFEKLSKDPIAALEHAGLSPVEFATKMRDGELTAAEKKEIAALDPELAAMLAEHKEMKAKAAKDAEKARLEEVRSQNFKLVSDVVNAPDFVAEFPAVVAVEGAGFLQQMLEQGLEETGAEPDIRVLAKRYNDQIVAEAGKLLTHEPTLKALLGNAELKAQLVKALGLAPAAPAVAKQVVPATQVKPATISNKIAAKVPSRMDKAANSSELAARLNLMLKSE